VTVGVGTGDVVSPSLEQPPLKIRCAAGAVFRCVWATGALLAQRRIHQPGKHVGQTLRFASGASAQVYRETVVQRHPTEAPAVLVVEFRLRWVRGRGHALFRAESLLNTPLFVGFPGFVSKLWLAHEWGRDELDAGEMWNSNSVISWCSHGLACVPRPVGRPVTAERQAGAPACSQLSAALQHPSHARTSATASTSRPRPRRRTHRRPDQLARTADDCNR